ncbi:hypothetical protein EDC01DRAFT_641806 [Geopyxis carbonaria]|nr:hypothetical protein EDC01DRAFT_641806 [Geopyxis carbonaria]
MFAHISSKDLAAAWLSQCTPATQQPGIPGVHLLPEHIIKICRDVRGDNETLALDTVRRNIPSLPTARLIDRCDGLNVFERVQGECAAQAWPQLSTAQKTVFVKQVQAWVVEMATKISPPASGNAIKGGICGLTEDGRVAVGGRGQLKGPWRTPAEFTADTGIACGHDGKPVFSYGDWRLENIFLSKDHTRIVAVVNWEGAGFFPDAGRSLQSDKTSDLWKGLFDGLEFPKT